MSKVPAGLPPLAGRIVRPRLTRRLNSVPYGGVGLVVAPAGSGKSVLMAEWASVRSPAWVSLSEAHNDARVLARALTSALHAVHDDFDPSIARLAVTGGQRLGSTFVDAFAAELSDLPGDAVVLVLDDVHNVTNSGLLDDLGHLLLDVPGNVRALASSRWDLPLGLGPKRLDGGLVEIRAIDLAFEVNEAQAMLQLASGKNVTDAQATALVERTEGWAAGLHLAAVSLATTPDTDAFIDGFAGDDRLIVDYLTNTILQDLDDDTRSFLLRTSVLEWLTPDLCAAVTGNPGAGSILHTLADRSFFMTRTAASADRFRLHQLFADVLRRQLSAEDPEAEAESRRRAASWLLAHHDYAGGIDQLIAGGKTRAAFDVLASQGHRLFERGEVATLLRALIQVQDAIGPHEPGVAIHLLAAQVGADEYTAAAENYRTLCQRADLSPGQRIAVDTLASTIGFAFLPLNEMRDLADGAFRALSKVERATVPDFLGAGGADTCETMAAAMGALATFLAGDLDAAARGFEETLELPGIKYPLWRINALGMFALTRAWQGRLNDASSLARASLDAAREVGAMDHVAVTCAQLALAMANLDRLDLGGAGIHLSAAASCVARCHRSAYDQLLHLQQVRHLAVTDSVQAALKHLHDAPVKPVRRPVIERSLQTMEVQLLVRSGSVREARRLLGAGAEVSLAAQIDVHVAGDDVTTARSVLDKWDPPVTDVRAALERGLRAAVVLHREGHRPAAGARIAEEALGAEAEGLLKTFVDAPAALHLLRTTSPARPLRRIRTLMDDTVGTHRRSTSNDHLVDRLTGREMVVLAYLPSRLSNGQIADTLYVSVNTLKTHLRNIYRKLGASDRDTAVERAMSLGLI